MKKALIYIFIIISIIPLLTMILFPGIDRDYENRALASFPDRISADFPTELQKFFADNFGFRPLYISLGSMLRYDLLNDTANGRVIAGKEGWLFFGETIDDYMGVSLLSGADMHRICRTLAQIFGYLENKGIRFIFIAAPNKNSIYGEYMPGRYKKNASASNLATLSDCLASTGIPYADLYGLLIENKQAGRLYHKKDTHWNNFGAYLAYAMIAQMAGRDTEAYEDVYHYTAADHYGDLQKMLTPGIKIYDDQVYLDTGYAFEYVSRIRSFDDFLIETSCENAKGTLVMFRDSFANALIPFLSGSFENAVYIRQMPFDLTAIDVYSPDYVMIEIAERMLPLLLGQAPLFPSAPLQDRSVGKSAKTGFTLNAEVKDDAVVYSGSIDSADIYEVYLRLCSPGYSRMFEAVVLDPGIEDVTGFSLMILKSDLPEGTYTVDIIYRNENMDDIILALPDS